MSELERVGQFILHPYQWREGAGLDGYYADMADVGGVAWFVGSTYALVAGTTYDVNPDGPPWLGNGVGFWLVDVSDPTAPAQADMAFEQWVDELPDAPDNEGYDGNRPTFAVSWGSDVLVGALWREEATGYTGAALRVVTLLGATIDIGTPFHTYIPVAMLAGSVGDVRAYTGSDSVGVLVFEEFYESVARFGARQFTRDGGNVISYGPAVGLTDFMASGEEAGSFAGAYQISGSRWLVAFNVTYVVSSVIYGKAYVGVYDFDSSSYVSLEEIHGNAGSTYGAFMWKGRYGGGFNGDVPAQTLMDLGGGSFAVPIWEDRSSGGGHQYLYTFDADSSGISNIAGVFFADDADQMEGDTSNWIWPQTGDRATFVDSRDEYFLPTGRKYVTVSRSGAVEGPVPLLSPPSNVYVVPSERPHLSERTQNGILVGLDPTMTGWWETFFVYDFGGFPPAPPAIPGEGEGVVIPLRTLYEDRYELAPEAWQ